MSPQPPTRRRRGAQPGNANALKHGFTARKDRPAPLRYGKKKALSAPLNYDEETELLRHLLARMARLYPDPDELIQSLPVFRKVMDIVFLQAAAIRALHPLTITDYENLAMNFEQLMGLIMNR
jgi:hypothetical protein